MAQPLSLDIEERGLLANSNLVTLLRERASKQSNSPAFTLLSDGEEVGATLIYSEVDLQARAIAAALQRVGAYQEPVLLLYPPGMDFVASFFGCVYAGAIAVPTQVPVNRSKNNQSLVRFQAILRDANPVAVLTTSALLPKLASFAVNAPDGRRIHWIATDEISTDTAERWLSPECDPDALALLQYTSGSTASPKGVMVSHRNLLTNSEYIDFGFEHTPQSVALTWLPHSHDMGLINGIIQPLYKGFHCFIMSPAAFIQSPYRWLKAISRHRVTHSGGPNFAYELCLRKTTAEQRAELDLSCWEVAFNGAEPVRKQTLEDFAAAFAPCGFRLNAFYPAYGLAEATLKVTGGRRMRRPVFITLDAAALDRNLVAESSTDQPKARSLVGAGTAGCETRIVIANPHANTHCDASEIGEIWVSGPGVAQGYWNREEETKEVFRAFLEDTGEGPFLRTGDLGFAKDGELFITGRIKDMIIIRGVNHYPQDIELSVERSHPALRQGGAAAFAIEVDDREQLIVAQEMDFREQPDLDDVIDSIRRAISENHELHPYAIALIKPGSLPKTTSGKIQRRLCRSMFLENSLDALSVWQSPAREQYDEWLAHSAPEKSEASTTEWLLSFLSSKLGVTAVSLDTACPITRYGLDSLDAIELAHQIQSTFGIALSFSDSLESPSISQLAARIWDHLSSGDSLPVISANVQEGVSTLSAGQQSLWFLQQVAPQSAAYNMAVAVRIVSEINLEALRAAFQALTDRHAMLRTTFSASQGEPFQRALKSYRVHFETEDTSSLTDDEIKRRLEEEAHTAFDFQERPPFKVTLYSRSDREHVLLLVAHHIVADLWSLALLLDELGPLYSSYRSGQHPQLEPQRFQYTDYVRWESERLGGPEGDRLRGFWFKQLSSAGTTLDLPSDRPRPKFQSFEGGSISFRINSELTGKIKQIGQEQGATLYMTLMAAFQVLLHRYSAQTEFVVGSPASGRSRIETANIVGYFVNPLVIRAIVSGAESFNDVLLRTRQTVIKALDHESYPFPLLVKQLQPERDTSRSPIFQVLFVLQRTNMLARASIAPFLMNAEGSSMKLGELGIESMILEKKAAQFDLSLSIAETGNEMLGSFEYSTDLFDSSTIKRMAEHFEILLRSIVQDRTQSVSHLQLVTELEQQLFAQWANTSVDYGRSEILSELFEEQVKRTPTEIALAFEDQALTYDELNSRANKLARRLRRQGVVRDVLVGVLMERSAEMVIGLLAILKAGGAYVPLDPHYPQERLSFMLEDAQLKTVLTEQRFADRAGLSGANVLALDSDWHLLSDESDQNLEPAATADSLAYVIYTSGSTGQPKGAMNTNRAICNRLCWMQEAYELDGSDRVLQKTPFTFDVSVWEFFWPLITGARLVLARPGGHQDSAYLVGLIIEERITTLHFVPSMLQAFLENSNVSDCRSVKRVICSGEALSADLERRFFARLGSELHNLYGPTETAVDVTSWVCERGTLRTRVPIGHPIANTQIHILDGQMQPAPIGVTGELHIAGKGLARGYLNRPDLTAEKFIPNPFGAHGARMYKTGDLARYLPGGEIEFLGRLDHQVKVRGFRIELGEIEAALLTHPAIRKAVVTAKEFAPGDTRLTAYVVPAEGHLAGLHYLRDSACTPIESSSAYASLRERSHRLPNGLMIAHDGEVQFNTMDIYREVFEKEIYLKHGVTLSDGDCIFDVGAHIGLFALFVNQKCKNARIYAFEPVPPTFEVLRANTSGSANDVKLFNLGLADRPGADLFYYYPRMTGVSGRITEPEEHKLRRKPFLLQWLRSVTGAQPTTMLSEQDINSILEEYFKSETFECRLSTLSDVIRENRVERIDLLKIDVEESEMDVLAGIRQEDWKRIEQVVVEVESKSTLDLVVALLTARDYDVFVENVEYGLLPETAAEQDSKARGNATNMIYALRREAQASESTQALVEPSFKILVGTEASPLAADSLRNHLLAKLPDYMVPSAFVLLDSLPLLSNGKVSLKALPPPAYSRQVLEEEYVVPRNETERDLVAIFEEVLGIEKVGAEDNFFKLGGHSLLATKAMSRILDRFTVELPLQRLFERPTAAGLAELITDAEGFRPETFDPIINIHHSVEERLLARLDELSDDEVEAFLEEIRAEHRSEG